MRNSPKNYVCTCPLLQASLGFLEGFKRNWTELTLFEKAKTTLLSHWMKAVEKLQNQSLN